MRETAIEVAGKTEDEAIQNALAKLGLNRDEVSVEILERAKTGFLGIGSNPARVKVTYMTDEEEVFEPEPVKAVPPVSVPERKSVPAPPVSVAPAEQGTPAQRAEQFLEGLFQRMDIPAATDIQEDNGTLRIELNGPNMGSVIGRRGEMLDAIQHLTSYVVNRGASKRTRIHIDAENYRKKREETLIRLAHKMAEKVVRYRKNMSLEPMNSYERHVIHAALQDVESVTTYSAGTEPNRRVFVAYNREKAPTAPRPQEVRTQTQEVRPPETRPQETRTHREWS